MSIKQHGDNLFKVTRFGMLNFYLIRENDDLTVTDTGIPGSHSLAIKAAKQIGGKIKRIIITHAHNDHIGGLDELIKSTPQAEVMMSERTALIASGKTESRPGEPQKPLKGPFPISTTKPTRLLRAGDQVGPLEVHASPGHTPGHISLFDIRDQTLIAGDAWQTLGGVIVVGDFNILFPVPPNLITWDKTTALESARSLLPLKPDRLVVGHGPVVDQPQARMIKSVMRFERNLS